VNIFDELRNLAADILEVEPDELDEDSSPETVGSWDSVQHLNLILAIEEQYGVQLDPEQIGGAATLGELASIVEEAQVG
jgi:acyl carrier protein